jgi:diguanylate cyclase (GGDEF)-like protein/PAS domain S-box-containing protein
MAQGRRSGATAVLARGAAPDPWTFAFESLWQLAELQFAAERAGLDIEGRLDAGRRLRSSEQWAHAVLQGSSDAVLVCDEDGVPSYASPAVREIFGIEPEDMIGSNHWSIVHPGDVEEAQRIVGGHGNGDAAGTHQFRIRRPDGQWRIVDAAVTDMRDNPAVQGLLVNVRDVTNRFIMEDLLAEQAGLLDSIARGAPLEITLQRITQMVEHVIGGAHCAVGVLEPDGAIRCHAAPNVAPAVVSFLDELSPDSDLGRQLRTSVDEPLTFDFSGDRLGRAGEFFRGQGYEMARVCGIVAPGTGELLGSIEVFQARAAELSDVEADLLERAVNLSAIAIERRNFESTLQYQALYDPLTGLPNRTLLRTRIEDALSRSRRLGSGVALLFLDLDRFKVINDSVGHELGDQLLAQFAERFQSTLRPGDTLARFGGDEFMIVCSRIPSVDSAVAIADRLMTELRVPITIDGSDGGQVFMTASVGIAFTDDMTATAESLISEADVALYRAKNQGRDQAVVFETDVDQQAVEQLALEQAIRHAIDHKEFELYFQPVVSLADGAMTHVEALVRWHRPGHGMVFPGVFIPVAEETGLIVPMGWWILEEACREAAAWPELPDGKFVEIAVNLSARQLASPDLIPTVRRVLEETGLEPHRLCFEVTESALVRDVEQAKRALLEVKSLGVHLAIDDFGTGYASLDYVRHFDMADYLKIDRSFVEGVDRLGSHEAAIVTAAIALARSLGLVVIAEGVETARQMEALRALECELAQGYLFSRPIPIGAAIDLLACPPTVRMQTLDV